MEITSVSRRYGGALYDFALEQDARDAVREDCAAMLDTLASSMEFANFVADPTIPPADAERTLVALFEGRADAVTLRFLRFLAAKQRLDQLPGVCVVFEECVCKELGIIKVAVTASHELTETQRAALTDKLGAQYNKIIDAEVRVDPALMGGFKIQVGDYIRDYSLATKLDKFEERVINARHDHSKLKG